VISDLLFQVGRGRLAGSPRDRDEFPALLAEFNQLIARGIGQDVAPPAGLDLDDLIRPFPAHFDSPRMGLDGFAAGRRPALRSASRSTYSICAFRLRSSSSDQRCTAARISALMRSG